MRTLGGLLAMALVALVIWLLWQPAVGVVPSGELAPSRAEPAATVELSVAPTAPPTDEAPSAPALRNEIPTPAPSGPSLARFFGRCVDAVSKQPLGGCKVHLHAWTGNTERMERHGRKIEWTNPPDVVTGADGRFEFTFDPPPPYQFAMDVACEGRASLSGRWGEVAAGEQKDLGDLELPFGARVSGTIVDSKGQPRGRTEIYIDRAEREARSEMGTVGLRSYTNSMSGAGGVFAFREPLGAGEWTLRTGSTARLKEPQSLVIEPGQAVVTLQVVVFADDEIDVIEGVVLDEQERPAAGVSLDPSGRGGGQRWSCSTDRAGKFRLIREKGDAKDPVQFSVNHADGYEPMQDARAFPWGTKDVVLHVQRAKTIEVQALDADTGAPIEEYGVRCFRDPNSSGGWSSSDFNLRAPGKHEQGIAQVAGVRRGKNLLIVEAADREAFATMAPIAFEVTDSGAPRQVVRLPRFAERTVEVVRTGGGAVVGTRVELLMAVEARPITTETMALEPRQIFQRGNMPQAMLACAATTDAGGRCQMRGARGATFVVRVLGPGHAPVVQPDVTLEGDVLRIAVPAGATLAGKLVPASVLAQFAPPAADLAQAAQMGDRGGAYLRSLSPGLKLIDPNGRRVPPGHTEWLPVADDGSFRIEGIPPGEWTVMLNYWTVDANGRGRSSGSEQLLRAALAEGEVRDVTLDVARLGFGELRGVVFGDDVPAADAHGQLMGMCPDGQGGMREYAGSSITTDAEGRFTARVLPGTWKLWLNLPTQRERWGRRLELVGAGEVRSGASADAVFRFVRKTLKARVVDADDRPWADRPIEVYAGKTAAIEQTDAQGTFTLDPALPGLMQFFTWPAELATQEQRNQAMRTDPAVRERRIPLGEHAIPADKKHDEITLRLPR